ncbi:MAG TPA: protein kinase [Polyangiaceae bacterium]|nr:protein kinase [Polyangiaceae bacterium]
MLPTSPDPAPSTPTQIGRYRIVARLGGGGMADVYLGVASGLVGFTKLSVVKVVKREIASEPEHVKLFLDEARISARLNHPNVVQTNEVGEDQGTYYLVMEYLEGQTLRRAMRPEVGGGGRGALPMFLRALSDVLAGLHYAHELCDYDGRQLGVVHRDVSPHNVFLTYEGSVKLVDFGIAKAAGALHLTGAGVLRGKFAYMAPEQARGEKVDRRADIYSAGVVLWEMLARRRMWNNEHELTILRRLTTGALPSLREHAPDAPRSLVAACEKALQLDPEKRFETAQDFRAAIESVLVTRGWHATSADVGALVSERFRDERADFRRRVEEAFTSGSTIQTLNSVPSLPAVAAAAASGSPSVPNLRPLPAAGRPASTRTKAAPAESGSQPPAQAARKAPSTNPPRSGPSSNSAVRMLAPPFPSPSRTTPEGTALPPGALAPTGLSVPPPPERARAAGVTWATPFLAVALLAVGSLYLWQGSPFAAPATAAPVASSQAVHSPPPPALPPPPPAASVEVHFKASPAEATLYLDGHQLAGNPFRGSFPRGGEHELRVEAKGYETSTQTLRFEQDVSDFHVALARLPASAPPPRPPPRADHNRPDTGDEPSPKRKRPQRNIDSELPY